MCGEVIQRGWVPPPSPAVFLCSVVGTVVSLEEMHHVYSRLYLLQPLRYWWGGGRCKTAPYRFGCGVNFCRAGDGLLLQGRRAVADGIMTGVALPALVCLSPVSLPPAWTGGCCARWLISKPSTRHARPESCAQLRGSVSCSRSAHC